MDHFDLPLIIVVATWLLRSRRKAQKKRSSYFVTTPTLAQFDELVAPLIAEVNRADKRDFLSVQLSSFITLWHAKTRLALLDQTFNIEGVILHGKENEE